MKKKLIYLVDTIINEMPHFFKYIFIIFTHVIYQLCECVKGDELTGKDLEGSSEEEASTLLQSEELAEEEEERQAAEDDG